MSSGSLAALVQLLGDESPAIASAVRSELARLGPSAGSALRRAARDTNPRRRARARAILAEQRRKEVLRRLLRHATRRRIDLEPALFLLGNLDANGLDARPYRRALDAMAEAAAERARSETDPLARVMAIPHYLGGDLGIAGSEDDYHHPDNIHLHRAIERKAGMPLTLCAIYLCVARRMGVRAAMIPLPGHVLLRLYFGGSGRSILVDPFQGGQVRSRSDCIAYLRECNLVPQPEWFDDADDASMFLRHVRNLANSLRMRGLGRRARDLGGLIDVLVQGETLRQRPALLD